LVENSGKVVPNVDNIENCTADKLRKIMVWFEASRQAHQPFSLIFQRFKF